MRTYKSRPASVVSASGRLFDILGMSVLRWFIIVVVTVWHVIHLLHATIKYGQVTHIPKSTGDGIIISGLLWGIVHLGR